MSANKTISIGQKPTAVRSADDWISAKKDAVQDVTPPPAPKEKGPIKRLTLDIPVELHGRIKAACALKGVKMVDEIGALLAERYPDPENNKT